MANFTERLKADLVEQFRGKQNIDAVLDAVGEQLQEVADFFEALRNMRSLQNAIGAQLDGAGDIVALSREEAGRLASITNPGEAVTDETYRRYLIYKVLKNTNTCTYPDIIKSFQMFWDKPLYYSENPDEPATMIFETSILKPGDAPEKLFNAPIIKPAGVGVRIVAATQNPELVVRLPIISIVTGGLTITHLPTLHFDAHKEV